MDRCISADLLGTGFFPLLGEKPGAALPVAPRGGNPLALKGPQVALVDSFSSGIDVNDDFISDLSHGRLVGIHIRERVPGVTLLERDIYLPGSKIGMPETRTEGTPPLTERLERLNRGIIYQFKDLASDIKSGKRIDAVNMSLGALSITESKGTPINFEMMAKETGLPLTPETLAQNKNAIRQKLKDWAAEKDTTKLTAFQKQAAVYAEVLDSIEAVTALGVPVYVAAGNKPDSLNLYGLAKGARLIGATDADGKVASFSARHNLISRQARGVYPAVPIKDGETLLGYDVTGDNKVDIPARDLSFAGRFSARRFLNKYLSFAPYASVDGTSFASPTALAEDLNQATAIRNWWGEVKSRLVGNFPTP